MKKLISLLTTVFILNLTGCGDAKSPQPSKSTSASQISGIVLQEEEPISKGQIEAKDRGGQKIAQGQWVSENHYSVSLPAGTLYPVVISVVPEGHEESLKAAVVSPGNLTQDITSTTSKLVDNAMVLGGITEDNLAKAARGAISARRTSGGGGGTSATFKGDPTKQYGGWH